MSWKISNFKYLLKKKTSIFSVNDHSKGIFVPLNIHLQTSLYLLQSYPTDCPSSGNIFETQGQTALMLPESHVIFLTICYFVDIPKQNSQFFVNYCIKVSFLIISSWYLPVFVPSQVFYCLTYICQMDFFSPHCVLLHKYFLKCKINKPIREYTILA